MFNCAYIVLKKAWGGGGDGVGSLKRDTLILLERFTFFTRRSLHSPQSSPFFLFPDRRKKEIAYLGMFKAKVLVLGPCEVNFLD